MRKYARIEMGNGVSISVKSSHGIEKVEVGKNRYPTVGEEIGDTYRKTQDADVVLYVKLSKRECFPQVAYYEE